MLLTEPNHDDEVRRLLVRAVRSKLRTGISLNLTAEGSSMAPLLRPGARLRLQAAGNLKVNDIVAVARRFGWQIHRVVEIRNRGGRKELKTRGDFAPSDDGWVSEAAVVGKLNSVDDLSAYSPFFIWRSRFLKRYSRALRAAVDLKPRAADRIVRTQHHRAAKYFYERVYRFGLKISVAGWRANPAVAKVFVKGSYARGDWTAGLSDVDFVVVHTFSEAQRDQFWRNYERMRIFFPFLGEVTLTTPTALNRYRAYGSHGHDTAHWVSVKTPGPPLKCIYVYDRLKFKLDLLVEVHFKLSLLSGLVLKCVRGRAFTAGDELRSRRYFREILKISARISGRRLAVLSPPAPSFESALHFCLSELHRSLFNLRRELIGAGVTPREKEMPSDQKGEVQMRCPRGSTVVQCLYPFPLPKNLFAPLRREADSFNDLIRPMLLTVRIEACLAANSFAALSRLASLRGTRDSLFRLLAQRRVVLLENLLARASNPYSKIPFTSLDTRADDLELLTEEVWEMKRLWNSGWQPAAGARFCAPMDRKRWIRHCLPELSAALRSLKI